MSNEPEKAGAKPPASGEKIGFDLYKVWKDYEEIAMHFNDLLLKIRTQSLAAVAAFATIAGVLLKGESISHELRWGTLTAVFSALCVFWLAIWILDFTYYNRLLLGAVKALVRIERESKSSNRTSSIYISTYIERAVALRDPQAQAASLDDAVEKAAVLADPTVPEGFELSKGRWTFYSLVFVLLVSLTVASIIQYRSPGSAEPSASTRQIPKGVK